MPCYAPAHVPDGLCSIPGAWLAPALCVFDTTVSGTAFGVPGSVQPTAGMPDAFPALSVLAGLVVVVLRPVCFLVLRYP